MPDQVVLMPISPTKKQKQRIDNDKMTENSSGKALNCNEAAETGSQKLRMVTKKR